MKKENYFQAWPSIEYLNPKLYIITEKLDGSNICTSIESDSVSFFTRQGKDALVSIPVLKKHLSIFEPLIKKLQKILKAKKGSKFLKDNFCILDKVTVFNVYGEFLNFLNMKRIKYASPRVALYKVFGISIGYESNGSTEWIRLSFPQVEQFLEELKLGDYLVPVYERNVRIGDICNTEDFPQQSLISDTTVEGWVFHPQSLGGRTYKLKNKNFLERLATYNPDSLADNEIFKELYGSYFTINRAYSVKSKLGRVSKENLSEAVNITSHRP